MDYMGLLHDKRAFQRETLKARMEEYGFKNISRMELFLWDLELYLQIQSRMGERVVLKGGAATQFYLPIEAQRTSVDIDMLFCGNKEEITELLYQIEKQLGDGSGLFHFRQHIPRNPKTTLPLFTYYTDIPSVLTDVERNASGEPFQTQELKVEFITVTKGREYQLLSGENLFAVSSALKYQILPINDLFADKLTTLGSTTIGVQDDRLDEQVKQFYDILMLVKYRRDELNSSEIWKKYLSRAEEEWNERAATGSNMGSLKGKTFSIKTVADDVHSQLERYAKVDNGEDEPLKKAINDFKSLYLNSKVAYGPADVACGAAVVEIMYDLLMAGEGFEKLSRCLETETMLDFPELAGREKGQMVRKVREMLVAKYSETSSLPANILKGKRLQRVFWAVINANNIESICSDITMAIRDWG